MKTPHEDREFLATFSMAIVMLVLLAEITLAIFSAEHKGVFVLLAIITLIGGIVAFGVLAEWIFSEK